MKIPFQKTLLCLSTSFMLMTGACTNSDKDLTMPASQKRVNETRTFNAADKDTLLKAVITTLQDQGYNIVKVNLDSSEITAQRNSNIILSVIIYPITAHQFAIRANGQAFNGNSFNSTGYENITDPRFYQQEFFEPLSKSVFLQKETL